MFNCEVITLYHSEDASALGAGIVAGISAGIYPSLENAVAKINVRSRDMPITPNVEKYAKFFRIYKQVYLAIKPTFEQLAELY